MARIRLFYGSTTGNTETVAEQIRAHLGADLTSVSDIAEATAQDLAEADALILGVSTWDDGVLQQDWEDFFPHFDEINLEGKKVALFGLGDAQGFGGQFVNGLGILHKKVKERGAQVIGAWPTDGYEFEDSMAVEGGHFVGLVIDLDNEPDKTEERIHKWTDMIAPQLAA